MEKSFYHLTNEGLHIEGRRNGKRISIDVIVVANGILRDSDKVGETCLEISGVPGIDKICLSSSRKSFHLTGGIYLGIRKTELKRSSSQILKDVTYHDGHDDRVLITYKIPPELRFEQRDYA